MEVRCEETSKEERNVVVLTEESGGGVLIQTGDEQCTMADDEGQLTPRRGKGGVEALLSDQFHVGRVGNEGFLMLMRREEGRGKNWWWHPVPSAKMGGERGSDGMARHVELRRRGVPAAGNDRVGWRRALVVEVGDHVVCVWGGGSGTWGAQVGG
jgi:hypothetical protein